jgi:hypothetical protein
MPQRSEGKTVGWSACRAPGIVELEEPNVLFRYADARATHFLLDVPANRAAKAAAFVSFSVAHDAALLVLETTTERYCQRELQGENRGTLIVA